VEKNRPEEALIEEQRHQSGLKLPLSQARRRRLFENSQFSTELRSQQEGGGKKTKTYEIKDKRYKGAQRAGSKGKGLLCTKKMGPRRDMVRN